MSRTPILMVKPLILSTVMMACMAAPQTNTSAIGCRSVGYFANWDTYGRSFNPQDLNSNALTHVLYAVANIRPDTGEVYLSDAYSDTQRHYPTDSRDSTEPNVYGCAKQLFLLKKENRNLKTLLSIGGWTYSANFAKPASTPAGRATFASSAIKLLQDLGFDGLDVDWEYPQNESQAADFVYLLAELRKDLDSYSEKHHLSNPLLLTIASPAGSSNYNILNLTVMDTHLDFWNLMTYDYSSSRDVVSSHNANWNRSSNNSAATPLSSEETVAHYIKSGVLPGKIVIGITLYGRSFADTHGPGKPFSGVGSGTWEPGVHDYKDLPQPGATVNTDISIGVAWTYDSVHRLMVSFDTPEIVSKKSSYIKRAGLGGAMWWESSGDRSGHAR